MTVAVKFETRYPANKEPQDWVLIAPRGEAFEKTQTWHRVSSLVPPQTQDNAILQSLHYRAQKARWENIQPAYDAWRANAETPIDGTPLAAWPGVSVQQVEFLRKMGILTVEHVRDMNDSTKAACRWPDAHKLPELAKQYLEGKDIAARNAENADLKERIRIMEEMLADNAPKKRGRPPKQESEAA